MKGFFSIFLTVVSFSAWAQIELEYFDAQVIQEGRNLELPFAGGINSVQYNELDIDLDGDLDLVLFDRSSDMITSFENQGDRYIFNATFEQYFPEDIRHWMVFADYNFDGLNDLFTYSNLGVRVLENVSLEGLLEWSLVADPLRTEVGASEVNLIFNATDIPAIVDIDYDGDMDILHYEFADGDYIIWQKNYAVERTGEPGLDFVEETENFGLIDTCDCDDFAFGGESCHEEAKVLHVGGKALLAYDHDADGNLDLVIGQEDCPNLNFLENKGDPLNATFDTFSNQFPGFNEPLNWPTFPAGFYLDVTFDGLKDLVVSQNVREDESGAIDFKNTSTVYANQGAHDFGNPGPFLIDQMIDVGSEACPAFADIDGDGREDLLISNRSGQIYYYRQTPDGYVFSSDDLFGLLSMDWSDLKIQFVDLTADGKTDLVVKARSAQGGYSMSFFENTSTNSSIQIELDEVQALDINVVSEDDFFFFDMDDDGTQDLLIGNAFGELDYYQRIGLNTYGLVEANILTTDHPGIFLSIGLGDMDRDASTELVTTRLSGQMEIFSGFPDNRSEGEIQILKHDQSVYTTRLGNRAKPAMGRFGSGTIVAVGTAQGGVRLFSVLGSGAKESLTLKVYPNPSEGNVFNFESNASNGTLNLYDLLGNQVFKHILEGTEAIDFSHLIPGVYIAQMRDSGRSVVQRILVY